MPSKSGRQERFMKASDKDGGKEPPKAAKEPAMADRAKSKPADRYGKKK